jgi:hypothetical protein
MGTIQITVAKLRLAVVAMGKSETVVSALCRGYRKHSSQHASTLLLSVPRTEGATHLHLCLTFKIYLTKIN